MRKLKWFTLVEILIVIVIIGILIWALVPRMQSAQWRARDVARKNDLSQLQSAIVTSYSDRWKWPDTTSGCTVASGWCAIVWDNAIWTAVIGAWLNWVPADPIEGNYVRFITGTNSKKIENWYWYAIWKKYWVEKAGFILMAHTEVEGWSNWLECGSPDSLSGGYLSGWTDLKDVLPCRVLTKTGANGKCEVNPWEKCWYTDTTQLRYILVY